MRKRHLALIGSASLAIVAALLWRSPKAERSAHRSASPAPVSAPTAAPLVHAVLAPTRPQEPKASAAKPTAAPKRAVPVVQARWGGGPGQLGKKIANESSPEGPMSFAVDEHGSAFVLDQVNGRVEVFEPGAEPRSVPLPADTFQDVALTKSKSLALLDRLATESVAYVDEAGHVTHEIGLVGQGIKEGGDVTGLFQRDDGTWVEVQHQNLVRVADADENPLDDRDIVQGRFAPDGSVLRASKSGELAAWIARKRGDDPAEPLVKVGFDLPVWQILSLDTDAHGRIFLGASLLLEGSAPSFDVLDAAEEVVVLEPNGAELTRVRLPANRGAEESFRRIRVGADGALYHMGWDERGVTLSKVEL